MTKTNKPATSDKSSDNQNTDDQSSDTTEQKKITSTVEKSLKKSNVTATKTPAAAENSKAPTVPVKTNNTFSMIALLLSIAALGAVAGHYYWQTQQQQKLHSELSQQFLQKEQQTEQQLFAAINQQQQQSSQQFNHLINDGLTKQNTEIAKLQQQLAQLDQGQSNDWLVKEAEYLMQVASRSLWLEKQPSATIALLNEAEQRLKASNDANLLPIREQIRADIEQLNLLPELAIEQSILSLMALNKQLSTLPIAMAYLPNTDSEQTDLTLSENTADWQENLNKTWQRFLDGFITVKRRTANVEALLSPEQQQNLRSNLSLKLELAQWAASRQHSDIYQQSLQDAQLWLNEYFDTDEHAVQAFIQQLQQLSTATITVNLPKQLSSLRALNEYLYQATTPAQLINEQAPQGESL